MPVAESVRLGEGVMIHHPSLVNLYGCTIGDETQIGSFVEIQKNAAVGARSKISSHSFICEGVTIGENSMIGAGAVVTRDVGDGELFAGIPSRLVNRVLEREEAR
jgi:acetyltransferase-like isoleucine patch superfamily enzyme